MPKLDSYKIDGFKIDGAMGGVRIKSIQTGAITISGTNLTATATVTEVDTTKAVLISNGCRMASDNGSTSAHIVLTNKTTITATRASYGSSSNTIVSYTLVEFEGVKSIQAGTIAMASPNAFATATVTEVNTDKSLLFNNGFTASNSDFTVMPTMTLTDAVTITASKGFTNFTTTVAYMLVEFN